MEAKKHLSELPNGSFLIDRHYFHYDGFNHSVCLLTFGFYSDNVVLRYTYHLLLDDVLIQVFNNYFTAVDYVRKLV